MSKGSSGARPCGRLGPAGAGLAALLALVLVPGVAWAQGPGGAPAKSMTLDQVVAAALQASPSVVQGEGAVRSAAAGERAAIGSFLPSVSLSSGATLAGNGLAGRTVAGVPADATAVGAQTTTSYTAGVSASMDVFDGGKRTAELARAHAESAQADAGLLQQRNDAGLAAKSDFCDVLRQGELVKAAQGEAQRAGEALSAAQDRLKAGAATRSDVLRAQLALTQAQQALSQAQSARSTAAYTLGRAVGYDGPVSPVAPASLDPRPLALTAAQLDSLVTTQAPAVHVAEASVKASQASVGAARSQYLPQLSVRGGYDLSAGNNNPALSGTRDNWSLSANVTLPVFDGFQREQAVTQANAATDAARATLEDARRGQRVDLQKDLAALDHAQNQIRLGQQAVASAQEDLRVQQERYRLGAATMLDVITSQTALTQAEQGLVNARFDYQVARAQVEALAGRSL